MTLTRPGAGRASWTESTVTISPLMPRIAAAWASRLAAPITTGLHQRRVAASRSAGTITSGPMPAPSPMVMAMTGSVAEPGVGVMVEPFGWWVGESVAWWVGGNVGWWV